MTKGMKDSDWQNKTVWLVGASSGIGMALAKALYFKGAKVVVSARKENALLEFVQMHPTETHLNLHQPIAMALDVLDVAALHQASARITNQGPIDRVVYCAGVYEPLRVSDWQLSKMKAHLDINYLGVLHVLDAVLPYWLNQHPTISTSTTSWQKGFAHFSIVSSVAGYIGLPNSLAYGPTKAALINLAETLYLDLKGHGVDVSLINPGFVETPLTQQNTFHMPALISADRAAAFILEGWKKGEFEIHFPKRFTMWLKLLKNLPYSFQFWAVKKFTGV